MFQFTHPGKGATRSPRIDGDAEDVSIHAPWEGCDICASSQTLHKIGFNSRTLGRVRRGCAGVLWGSYCFNSRTLGRVRRAITAWHDTTIGVSIHAPWEGCDSSRSFTFSTRALFQFTHPGKGATGKIHYSDYTDKVSIHAPWEGCDSCFAPVPKWGNNVSIHAPWEGCDSM